MLATQPGTAASVAFTVLLSQVDGGARSRAGTRNTMRHCASSMSEQMSLRPQPSSEDCPEEALSQMQVWPMRHDSIAYSPGSMPELIRNGRSDWHAPPSS